MSSLRLVLVRGPSGSGKTTYALANFPVIQEADGFWSSWGDEGGNYKFNPKFLPEAHQFCLANTARGLYHGETVCVANTFTRIWEMQKYFDLAEKLGIPVEVYRCTGEYQNVHGVPEDKVQQMRDRMEDYEGEIFV